MREPLHNRRDLKNYRKKLRNSLTPAEATLWIHLKNKKLDGRKFRRQHSVGSFILDFYCPSEKLAIELDGQGHFTEEGIKYDQDRTQFLEAQGIKVIRFENIDVFENLEGVLEEIRSNIS